MKKFKKAIETLEAQNENGQFDQVINKLKVEFKKLEQEKEQEKKLNEMMMKYGLTPEEILDVNHAVGIANNPFDVDFVEFGFSDEQMRLYAKLWSDYDLYNVEGEIKTYDEAKDYIKDNIEEYVNLDEILEDNFDYLDEDDIYNALIEKRNEEQATSQTVLEASAA